MSEINMVPLIDIMLVLLIIFIITVPVIKHAVNVELPQASAEPEHIEPQTISLSIDRDGQFFLDTTPVSDDELRERLAAEAEKNEQPSLHISGDRDVRYERVAKAMAMARETGLQKIGFVTEPDGAPGEVDPSAAPGQADGASRHHGRPEGEDSRHRGERGERPHQPRGQPAAPSGATGT